MEAQQNDHLDNEERGERGDSQIDKATGLLQKVTWNCPSFLPHEIERRGILRNGIKYRRELGHVEPCRGNRL